MRKDTTGIPRFDTAEVDAHDKAFRDLICAAGNLLNSALNHGMDAGRFNEARDMDEDETPQIASEDERDALDHHIRCAVLDVILAMIVLSRAWGVHETAPVDERELRELAANLMHTEDMSQAAWEAAFADLSQHLDATVAPLFGPPPGMIRH